MLDRIFVLPRRLSCYLFALLLLFAASSCKNDKPEVPDIENASQKDSADGWLNWNIVFPANTTADQRNKQVEAIKNDMEAAMEDTANSRGIGISLHFSVNTCICDSLLYNLEGDLLLWGATGSNTTPPPPKDPGASGDALLGSLIAVNDLVSLPEDSLEYVIDYNQKPKYSGIVSDRVKIAIIDTGIDSLIFTTNSISRLLWQDPATSLNNFLIGGPPQDFNDKNTGRHGSAVAALALTQFKNELPRIMILKALDDQGKGSIFTVSCALSYAAQNRATLVNASLGYYGSTDNVLQHYIHRVQDSAAMVVVAAGNRPGIHDKNSLCNTRSLTDNPLGPNNLFYPACFNGDQEVERLITVTGIADADKACFHQNFSNQYVDVGVLSKNECCAYFVPFTRKIEGSSFATPIVTGRIGSLMLLQGTNRTKAEYLSGIGSQPISPAIIRGGNTVNE